MKKVFLFLILAGCGGGMSGSGGSGAFGLTERVPVDELAFPLDPANPNPMNVEIAFPNLNFSAPLYLTHAPDNSNRIFVVEQGGQIHVFANNPASNVTTVFLDISSIISSPNGEEGLLGLAFDPNYATNGYFYINYTAPNPLRTIVARYKVSVNPNVADPNSGTELLAIDQPFANHNGGMMAFGPDGFLYIASGDGGAGGDPQNNGQTMTTLLGKILRIDPHGASPYAIPSDNPFVGTVGRGEIWAYGLRNPWRFSFDRGTGRLWLGDVGQNEYEEIDIVKKGDNLGWKICEGLHIYPGNAPCTTGALPIHEYDHNAGQSITGGYVYRGNLLTSLRGAYIYGDFVTSTIWALVYDGTRVVSNTVIATLPQNLSSFGEDQNGEVYAIGYGGRIYKFTENTGGTNVKFPTKLSETKLFVDTAKLIPQAGLVEYGVKVPLWSDSALKKRWIALPGTSQIKFNSLSSWDFPKGTVFVKHFELQVSPTVLRRLETRVLVHQTDGWYGYTYKWNSAQTDADLLTSSVVEDIAVETPAGPILQRWSYPSRTDCLRCHTEVSKRILGANSLQLNHDFSYPKSRSNQLATWNHIGLFSEDIGGPGSHPSYPDIDDESVSLELRSKAYLSANCAQCHTPGGPTPTDIDLRFFTLTGDMNLIGVAPTAGDLGLTNPARIRRGARTSSVLWERMRRLDETRMPPLSSGVVDQKAVSLIGRWIDSL